MTANRRCFLLATLGCALLLLGPALLAEAHGSPLHPGRSLVSSSLASASGPLLGSEITISALDHNQYAPAVAYNSNHHEYLVLWYNLFGGGQRDIYAQRLSATGQLLSWFAVTWGTETRDSPAVAYDPDQDRYLVVWVHDTSGNWSNTDIYGRFVAWDGSSLGPEFAICDWTGSSQHSPSVVYGSGNQEYLVVWHNEPSASKPYLSGRRVRGDGSGFSGAAFTVYISAHEVHLNPDVAYNAARNEYFVAWQRGDGTDFQIYAVPISATGAVGTEVAVGQPPSASNEMWTTVAACAEADQYLVVWTRLDQSTGDTDIYGRFMQGGGATDGAEFALDDTPVQAYRPDVGSRGTSGQYLVAWEHEFVGFGIRGRTVFSSKEQMEAFTIVLPGASAYRRAPAVAAGVGEYLVAWQHDRDGSTYMDIHGRLVARTHTFTGAVYQGHSPAMDRPMAEAAVTLFGDEDAWPEGGAAKVLLAEAISDGAGEFELRWVPSRLYPYYHVIEVDPVGATSTGVQAGVDGIEVDLNTVSYQSPSLGTYGGIAFWDELPSPTATATGTATPTRTATTIPTGSPTPGVTPTVTQPVPATGVRGYLPLVLRQR